MYINWYFRKVLSIHKVVVKCFLSTRQAPPHDPGELWKEERKVLVKSPAPDDYPWVLVNKHLQNPYRGRPFFHLRHQVLSSGPVTLPPAQLSHCACSENVSPALDGTRILSWPKCSSLLQNRFFRPFPARGVESRKYSTEITTSVLVRDRIPKIM